MFNRGAHPVIVFDRDGGFLRSWGEDIGFVNAHGAATGCLVHYEDSPNCSDAYRLVVRALAPDPDFFVIGRQNGPRSPQRILLIVILILLFGGGGGYWAHQNWGGSAAACAIRQNALEDALHAAMRAPSELEPSSPTIFGVRSPPARISSGVSFPNSCWNKSRPEPWRSVNLGSTYFHHGSAKSWSLQ